MIIFSRARQIGCFESRDCQHVSPERYRVIAVRIRQGTRSGWELNYVRQYQSYSVALFGLETGNFEARATHLTLGDVDIPAVGLDNFANDCESESRPF